MNNLVKNIAHILPKNIVRTVASKYVAGPTLDDGLYKIKLLNNLGFSGSLDLLGEEINCENKANNIVCSYLNLIEGINGNKLDCNISLKLSSLGLNIDENLCWSNLKKILDESKKSNMFVRIEMEDSSTTNKTLKLYKYAKDHYNNCGTVVQSCLFRTLDDIKSINNNSHINIRLCKGAYKEHSSISYTNYETIKNNYMNCADYMLNSQIYSCFATHDLDIINNLVNKIEKKSINSNKYEFQALYGVPIEKELLNLVNNGHKVRCYVPYGPDWYEFSLRRIRENPDIWKKIIFN